MGGVMVTLIKEEMTSVLNYLLNTGMTMPVFIHHNGISSPGDIMRFVEGHAERNGIILYLWANFNGQMQASINIKPLVSVIESLKIEHQLEVRDELRALLPAIAYKDSNFIAAIANNSTDLFNNQTENYELPKGCTVSFNDESKAIIMAVPEC
jgi:hypothetical protein